MEKLKIESLVHDPLKQPCYTSIMCHLNRHFRTYNVLYQNLNYKKKKKKIYCIIWFMIY